MYCCSKILYTLYIYIYAILFLLFDLLTLKACQSVSGYFMPRCEEISNIVHLYIYILYCCAFWHTVIYQIFWSNIKNLQTDQLIGLPLRFSEDLEKG